MTSQLPADYLRSPLAPTADPPEDLKDAARQIKTLLLHPNNLAIAPLDDLVRFLTAIHEEVLESDKVWEKQVEEAEQQHEALRGAAALAAAHLGLWQQLGQEILAKNDGSIPERDEVRQYVQKLERDKVGLQLQVDALCDDEPLPGVHFVFDDGTGLWLRPVPGEDPETTINNLPPNWEIPQKFHQLTQLALSRDMANPSRLTLLFAPGVTLESFWDTIPDGIKQGRPQPNTPDELRQFLIDAVTTPPQTTIAPCAHPSELARHTGDPTGQQPWDASIQIVDDLMDHPMPPVHPPPAIVHTAARLFKTSEVPKLEDTTQYEEYRARLVAFVEAENEPDPTEYSRALLRLRAGLTAPTAVNAARDWEVQPLVRPRWLLTNRDDPTAAGNPDSTVAAFLTALDQKFQSATLLDDTTREYMKCHPKPSENPQDFFNQFEAAVNKRRSVERRCGAPTLTNDAIIDRLTAIMPRYLTDHLKLHHGGLAGLKRRSLQQLRTDYCEAWSYLPKAPTGPPAPNPRVRTAPRNETEPRNEVKTRQCGLTVSYDSAPPVPQALRGSLYAPNDPTAPTRRNLAASMNVCEYCRRPREQHQTVGANFKPVTRAGPNVAVTPRGRAAPRMPSPPPGPRVEDVTEQRALPAPPIA